jgi:hypothetical protein
MSPQTDPDDPRMGALESSRACGPMKKAMEARR